MKVLLVIDLLKGFCRKGYPLSLADSTLVMENYIINRIEKYFAASDKVIFVCDNHSISDPEINNPYPPHCMHGSTESEIVDELESYATKSTVLYKNTLSIFLNTGLEEILKKLKPTEIEVTGVCTEICDLFAVFELRIRGYNVFISSKGVLPLDSKVQNEFINYYKNRLGAKVSFR
ncbi:MAG: isochorismatase family cysteine hydrolase [Bacteroidota bacterium]|nr:isochorismatase family cysteine hydrolase [Bacteroidota bacterium]